MLRDFGRKIKLRIDTRRCTRAELSQIPRAKGFEVYDQVNETLTDWLKNYFKIIVFNGENIGSVDIDQFGGIVA